MNKELNFNSNDQIEKYLDEYIATPNPKFAVLLKGKWGAGKTYFIKNKINQWKNKETNILDEETIELKPIYISLYGVKTKNEIISKIKEVLNPLLYSKSAKIIKKILFGVIKTATSINIDTDGDGETDGRVSINIDSIGILKSDNEKIKGSKILIFDDLERANIRLNELFGYINEFVEHLSCNVILIGDETKFTKQNEDLKEYNEFKEKLIGQTLTLSPNTSTAIQQFVKTLNTSKSKIYSDNLEIIKELFIASKIENLRILRQAIFDFDRFTSQFSNEITSKENYNTFCKSLIAHFLLVYLEYKNGNHKISGNISRLFEDEDEDVKNIRLKYKIIIDKFQLQNEHEIINYEFISEFINNGYSNITDLNNSILENKLFRTSKLQNWEKLWLWSNLENEEFTDLLKEMKKEYKNNKIDNPYILIHIAMIFYELDLNKIHTTDIKKLDLELRTKFEEILNNSQYSSFQLIKDFSHGKGYLQSKSAFFINLKQYCNERIKIYNTKNQNKTIKLTLESITNKNINELEIRLSEISMSSNISLEKSSIFSKVNPKILTSNILSLTNHNIQNFIDFLNKRYFPEQIYANVSLGKYCIDDFHCLNDLMSLLNNELNHLSSIKKFQINILIDTLDKILIRIETLKSQA
ncbi:P-loop NTPase fold protein [Wenyingzhuangia sp. IMCC45574]